LTYFPTFAIAIAIAGGAFGFLLVVVAALIGH
jgi:hypothetical protein